MASCGPSATSTGRNEASDGEVVATAGEILLEEDEKVFERDSATDDTRVRTAIAWLEEAVLLKREENQVRVFPSSLRVSSGGKRRAPGSKGSRWRTPTGVSCCPSPRL